MCDRNEILDNVSRAATPVLAEGYRDLLKPFATEAGNGLGHIGRFINTVLKGFDVASTKLDRKWNYYISKANETVESIPPDRRVEPSLGVLQPIINGSWGALDSEVIQDLFLSLLKTSMDRNTAAEAFPIHGELIKQLSPDEALIMVFLSKHNGYHPIINAVSANRDGSNIFSIIKDKISLLPRDINLKHPENTPIYLDNLERSGLIKTSFLQRVNPENLYKEVENTAEALSAKSEIEKDPSQVCQFKPGIFYLSNLGKSFCRACISDSMRESFL